MREPQICYLLPRDRWNRFTESKVLIAFIRVQAEVESKNLANGMFSFLQARVRLGIWKTIC